MAALPGIYAWNGSSFVQAGMGLLNTSSEPQLAYCSGGSSFVKAYPAFVWTGSAYEQVYPPVVSYDATGTGTHAGSGAQSWTHHTGSQADALIIGFFYNGIALPSSVTVNSSSSGVTLISTKNSSGYYAYLYLYYCNPNTSYTIAVTLSSSAYMCCNSSSYCNVAQYFTNTYNNTTISGTNSLSFPALNQNLNIGLFGSNGSGSAPSPSSGTTRWSFPYSFAANYPAVYVDKFAGYNASGSISASGAIVATGMQLL